MLVRSEILSELVEPVLFALHQARGEQIRPVLGQARAATVRARELLRASSEALHMPSFELGVATSMTELLATADQRSFLNDAIHETSRVPQGLQALHEIALIERSATEITQQELAARLGADRGNFNRRIRRLEELGLVESTRRRQARVYGLTGLGLDVLNELRPGWKAQHPASLAPISTEQEAERAATRVAAALLQDMLADDFRREMTEQPQALRQTPSRWVGGGEIFTPPADGRLRMPPRAGVMHFEPAMAAA